MAHPNFKIGRKIDLPDDVRMKARDFKTGYPIIERATGETIGYVYIDDQWVSYRSWGARSGEVEVENASDRESAARQLWRKLGRGITLEPIVGLPDYVPCREAEPGQALHLYTDVEGASGTSYFGTCPDCTGHLGREQYERLMAMHAQFSEPERIAWRRRRARFLDEQRRRRPVAFGGPRDDRVIVVEDDGAVSLRD